MPFAPATEAIQEITMPWKESVRNQLLQFRDARETERFSLQEFYRFAEADLAAEYPNNNHVRAKIRQTLQRLRDDGEIEFVNDQGDYELAETDMSDASQEDKITILEQLEAEFE